MKKKYFLLLIIFLIICIKVSAKEMQLFSNDIGEQEFNELSLEDQFSSYLNSFRYIIDLYPQSTKWAKRMVIKYGNEVIPYVNEELQKGSFSNNFRKPYDSVLVLLSYIISNLNKLNLLTENELLFYKDIFEKKLEEYIREYKIIDGTVRVGIKCIIAIGIPPIYYNYDSLLLKNYFEEKKGIIGIKIGDLNSMWE